MNTIALILAIILFIAGLLGTLLPILPGAVLVYAGLLLYGFMTQFETLNLYFFIMQAIVLIIIFAADYASSAIGTKLFGGSKQAAIGAIIGTILALIFLGPAGILIGPLVGAIAVELLRGVEFKQALRAGLGTLVGVLGGTLFKLCAEILMIVYFLIKIL